MPHNCKYTSGYNSGLFQKYSRMLITQQSGCASGTDCSRNLNLSTKNQNSAHLISIQIVKYWSHRVKFSIYPPFKAFRTSHQLMVKVVYRSNGIMWVKYSGWMKSLMTMYFCNTESILILRPSCKGWWNEQHYHSPFGLNLLHVTSKAFVFNGDSPVIFKISNWASAFILNLKYWYLSKTIPFLGCPLIPTFLLIRARRCNQKNRNIFSRGIINSLGSFFVLFFPHSCPHLILISGKKTEGHM